MKELILENPPRKKGKKRRTAAQRRATAKMLAANRAKRRGRKSSKRKSSKRRTKKTYSVKRRSTRKTYKSMARKSRKSHRRRKASHRRRKTHTYLVRGSATPIKLNGLLGSVFSKDNLTIAGGAVAATVVTNFALGSTVAQKLPGLSNPYARAAYMLLVPVVGGMVTKRMSPNLAKGMVIGGLVNFIAQLQSASKIGPAGLAVPTLTTAATGEYLGEYLGEDADETYLGEYLGEDLDDSYMGEYLGEDVGSVGAFEDSAW